jgi:hypothetical protein
MISQCAKKGSEDTNDTNDRIGHTRGISFLFPSRCMLFADGSGNLACMEVAGWNKERGG